MSAPLHRAEHGFLARYEALRDGLPGEPAARAAAAASFRAAGLPSLRDEAWKYTSLRPVAEASFALETDPGARPARAPLADAAALVMVNGRLSPGSTRQPATMSASGPGTAALGSFASAPAFGRLARPERHPLVALNTMLAEDGATIDVPAGVAAGVLQLVSVGRGNAAFHPRHRIRLGEGASLTLLDVSTGEGGYLHNPVAEIELAEGARLVHVRLLEDAPEAFHLATVYAEIAAGAVYDAFALTLGGRVARSEFHARLGGPGAAVHLNGAQLLAGRQVGDFTSVVSHDAPNCASRQTVKNVLAGRSRGVFQGRIEVARAAQKTDGYQMNQALLLSPEAEIDSKPELEIFADDVKCSHGATVGELDADQLFYLRARGIPEADARSILVRAFLAEALDLVADDAVRAVLDAGVASWWERQAA